MYNATPIDYNTPVYHEETQTAFGVTSQGDNYYGGITRKDIDSTPLLVESKNKNINPVVISGNDSDGVNKLQTALMNAYYEKISSYLDLVAVVDSDTAINIIGLSQRYSRPLSTFPEARVFIGTLTQTIRNSLDDFNESKTTQLKRAIKNYINSSMGRDDNSRFTNQIIAAGLSPLIVK